ncbi:MAG: hypothetical protein RLZZ188_3498, partial [Verrucomicrobiota bacterium]
LSILAPLNYSLETIDGGLGGPDSYAFGDFIFTPR